MFWPRMSAWLNEKPNEGTSAWWFDKVKKYLTEEKLKIDFLFIDGDHSYEGVKSDFELYSQLLSPTGVVCFDDVVTHPGVKKFFAELTDRFAFMLYDELDIGFIDYYGYWVKNFGA